MKTKRDNVFKVLSLVAQQERTHLPIRRHGFDPWLRKSPWKRKWQPISARSIGTSSILAREIPWTVEPGGFQSMESQKSRTQLSD